jgi:uncharacterized membrane protein YfcA
VELWALALGGVAAGAINAVVGSGTLVTYPLLLAYGLPPVVANGTNSLGMAPGGMAAAWGYRRELRPRWRGLVPYVSVMVLGAVLGAVLVVALPPTVFALVVPWLILIACALVVVQPMLSRRLAARGVRAGSVRRDVLLPALFVTGTYCGYFGAATGIVLMAVLALLYDPDLQQSNALKNLVTGAANLTAAIVFASSGRVDYLAAVAVAVGASVGGLAGAPFARRLPDAWLRGLLVLTGLIAAGVSIVRTYG